MKEGVIWIYIVVPIANDDAISTEINLSKHCTDLLGENDSHVELPTGSFLCELASLFSQRLQRNCFPAWMVFSTSIALQRVMVLFVNPTYIHPGNDDR